MATRMKGQTLLSVIMWAAGVSISVGGIAYGITSSHFSTLEKEIKSEEMTNAKQDTIIALLQQSACVQNQNIMAIAKALKVTVISDPSCK